MGRPRREPGQRSTRDRILQVSIVLFTDQGFANTSFRNIADALGLTESAIYRHFANKDEVLDTILDQFQDQIYQPLPSPPKGGADGSLIANILTGLPRLLLTQPLFLQTSRLLLGELQHNERIRSFVKEAFVIRANTYVESLIQEISDSSVTAVQEKSIALMVNSFRFGWVYSTFVLQSPTLNDLPELERELNDISNFLDQAISNQIIRQDSQR